MNKALGTHEIARICQVTPPTAIRWIKQGKLPSFTTAGGHRRVWDRDLIIFLKKHNLPIPPGLDASRLTVLIVDDEAIVRRLIARVTSALLPEAEIHEAENGFDAGRKAVLLVPSLMILDLQLPGMDGLKICQSIRSDPNLKRVKILAITGQNIENSRQQFLSAGADDFLGKPFDNEQLGRTIEKLLAHHNTARVP